MRASRGLQDSRIKVRHNYQTVFLNLNILGPYSTLLLDAERGAVCVGGARALPAAAWALQDFAAILCGWSQGQLGSRRSWGSTNSAAGQSGARCLSPPGHWRAVGVTQDKVLERTGEGKEKMSSLGGCYRVSACDWEISHPFSPKAFLLEMRRRGWEQQAAGHVCLRQRGYQCPGTRRAVPRGTSGATTAGICLGRKTYEQLTQFRKGYSEKFTLCLLTSDSQFGNHRVGHSPLL